MSKPENLIHIPHCDHIKDNGVRCGSPALRGRKLCYFHDRQRKTFPHRRPYRSAQFCRTADFFNVRTNEDVMIALNQVMNGLLRHQLSTREAGALIFALQTALIYAVPEKTTKPALSVDRHRPTTNDERHPKSVSEFFDIFPDCDDLRAMLTPEDVAELNSLCGTR